MRKTVVTAWIFSLYLFVFTLNSFGVPVNYEEPIEGLEFDFSPGLPVTLPGIGEFTAIYATVEAPGRENIVITPSGQYNYHAKLGEGVIYADTIEYGVIPIEMESATLVEHFTIEGEIPEDPLDIPVPDDLDLYFKANLVTDDGTVKFKLKIKHSQVQFIRP